MRPSPWKLAGIATVVPAVLIAGLGPGPSRGDEPGRFGRLFRMGTGPSASASSPPSSSSPTLGSAIPGPSNSTPGAPALLPPSSSLPGQAPASDGGPRLVPQPRNSRAFTEADPVLTQVAIGRSDDGKRFGMFLEVFADGTVLDSEGVHHVPREAIRALTDAIQAADAFRLRGHCGSPATDFIEQIHVVVYDRSLGRLRANAFSYSGNTQSCDHAIHHLKAAIEALQAKVAGPPSAAPLPAVAPTPAPTSPASPPPHARTIPLTPLN